LQNQAKNSAFNHRFYNLFSDIFSGAVFKQAYRLGQLAKLQVGGWFTQNSANNNSIQGTLNVRSVGQMRRKFLTTCTIKGTRGGNLQADVPQYGRSLPICAKDTPHFWSEVYKLGTRARKAQVDLVQGGRSMIEMLGVLAIIGVLSVGGIAGYSKAMMKVKTNKTVDLISQIVANTQTLYKSQDSYAGLNDVVIKKAKLVPESFVSTKSDSYSIGVGDKITSSMINPFGGGVVVTPTTRLSYNIDNKAFAIVLYDVPEDACMELLTLDWGSTTSGLIAVGINNGTWSPYIKEGCTGTSTEVNSAKMVFACPGKSGLTVPMPVSTAAEICSGNNNSLFWKYY
jgi:Tfp pilus assembly protein PilE